MDIIQRLAMDMATNIVDTSTVSARENKECISMLLADKIYKRRYENAASDKILSRDQKRVRNILIIGAGASRDVNPDCFVSAWDLTETLFSQIKKSENPELKARLAEAEHRILRGSGVKELDFEQKMQALAMVMGENYIVQRIKYSLGYKHMTSLFYEMAAHMFKQRALDVIINYNFDETLDNIIEDEMAEADYYRIYLNGHCPESYEKELLIDHRLRVPIYIKPHGTMSHLGSLKFTKEQYYKTRETRMTKLILELLTKPYEEKKGDLTSLPVNIITAGYSLNDFDFADIIEDACTNPNYNKYMGDDKFHLYTFDSIEESKFNNNSGYIHEGSLGNRCRKFHIQGPLGESFKLLWQEVDALFNRGIPHVPDNRIPTIEKKIFPRSISRHQLMAVLFQGMQPCRYVSEDEFNTKYLENEDARKFEKENDSFRKYLEKKILIEIAILIGRSSGVLHIRQIRESRAGKYISIYFDKFGAQRHNYECLSDFLSVFSLRPLMDGYLIDTFDTSHFFHGGNVIYDAILEKCIYRLEVSSEKRQEVGDLFKSACQSRLLNLIPNYRKYYSSVFRKISKEDLLYSDIRWFYKFRSFFQEKRDWNLILCTTENGWIWENAYYREQIKKKNAKLGIVLADYNVNTDNKASALYSVDRIDLLNGETEPRLLPWWLHNKHLVIFLNLQEDGSLKETHEGIFYSRRLLSNKVNPVHIQGREDVTKLIKFFFNYWYRASLYKDKIPPNYDHINEDSFFEAESKFLYQLYRSVYPQRYDSMQEAEKYRLESKMRLAFSLANFQ